MSNGFDTGGFRAQQRFSDPTEGLERGDGGLGTNALGVSPESGAGVPAASASERSDLELVTGGLERSDRGMNSGGQERSDPGMLFGGQERSDRGMNSGGQERSDRGMNFGGQERSDRGMNFGGPERSERPKGFVNPRGRHGEVPPEWTALTPPWGLPRPGGASPSPVPPPTSTDLSTATLLRQSKPPPSTGWRRWLYQASFKTINVGESPRTIHRNNLIAQVNQPLQGCYRLALLSLKGGVGKTTITAGLGATFASIRGDRVVAVDANPDRGTLSQKVPLETPATVRHLLRDVEGIQRYGDVRSYTSQGPSRLEVLASDSDPSVSDAFSSEDYNRTLDVLERFYSLVLTDCGTGLMHSAMTAVLSKVDALIVISSASIDGARSASATLDWLDAHGHQDLVRKSVAVINAVRPRSGKIDMQKVVDHFSRRCRAVRLVPFDPHLEEGAEISLDQLRRETRDALIELAAVVADGFPGSDRHKPFV